eukprot:scaffold1741_cov409-Prasinococcus_capsulatus_cf.AAC.16
MSRRRAGDTWSKNKKAIVFCVWSFVVILLLPKLRLGGWHETPQSPDKMDLPDSPPPILDSVIEALGALPVKSEATPGDGPGVTPGRKGKHKKKDRSKADLLAKSKLYSQEQFQKKLAVLDSQGLEAVGQSMPTMRAIRSVERAV